MADRCGDLAYILFEVSPELVGAEAFVWVKRENAQLISGTYTQILEKASYEMIEYPDQESKNGSGKYYSGRMADFRGLDKKSYKDKMSAQRFKLRIYVNEKHHDSNNNLQMDAYTADAETANVGRWAKGIPMSAFQWKIESSTDAKGNKTIKKKLLDRGKGKGKNCGSYHIKIKDAVTTITVKLNLVDGKGNKVEGRIFDHVKSKAEAFWNAPDKGFMQFVYHRTDCMRKKGCRCSVIVSENKEVIQAGCCKFPLRLKVEEGGDNRVEVRRLTPFELEEKIKSGRVFPIDPTTGKRRGMNTGLFYFPSTQPNSYAHEIGHMMGFPDQYLTGWADAEAIDKSSPKPAAGSKSKFPIDDESIMGRTQGKAKECHFSANWIMSWVSGMLGESIETIKNPAEE